MAELLANWPIKFPGTVMTGNTCPTCIGSGGSPPVVEYQAAAQSFARFAELATRTAAAPGTGGKEAASGRAVVELVFDTSRAEARLASTLWGWIVTFGLATLAGLHDGEFPAVDQQPSEQHDNHDQQREQQQDGVLDAK